MRTHETGGVGRVGANLAINLDQALHDNRGHLTSVERILQAVTEEDHEGKRLAKLVWTRGGTGSLSWTVGR